MVANDSEKGLKQRLLGQQISEEPAVPRHFDAVPQGDSRLTGHSRSNHTSVSSSVVSESTMSSGAMFSADGDSCSPSPARMSGRFSLADTRIPSSRWRDGWEAEETRDQEPGPVEVQLLRDSFRFVPERDRTSAMAYVTQQLSQQQAHEDQQQGQQQQQQQHNSNLCGPHSPRSTAQGSLGAKDSEPAPHLLLSPDVLSDVLARFRSTLRVLLIDTTIRRSPSLFSWLSALLLLVLVPLFVYLGVKPADNLPQHQLPFQLLAILFHSCLGISSFLFLSSTIRKHGLHSVLFLDAAVLEEPCVQLEYEKCLQQSTTMLTHLLALPLLLHLIHKLLLFSSLPLQPVLLPPAYLPLEASFLFLLGSCSWLFAAATFLFACVLFWKACSLQELRMLSYRDAVAHCSSPALCFSEYTRIADGLTLVSHRFRAFLLAAFALTLLGGLASMFEMVHHRSSTLSLLNSGHLLVANFIAVTGTALCLRSAAKLAHHHRRIVRVAAAMHAHHSFEHDLLHPPPPITAFISPSPPAPLLNTVTDKQTALPFFPPSPHHFDPALCSAVNHAADGVNDGDGAAVVGTGQRKCASDSTLGSQSDGRTDYLLHLARKQDAWQQRAALVNYLSNTSAGISIYGFLLDRFFIHASIGALLTTTWFILGQSLSSSFPPSAH